MTENRNIRIERHTPGNRKSFSSLWIEGDRLAVIGGLPHATTIEPDGPDDAARLLFYADRHLRLIADLADAVKDLLVDTSEQKNADYYDHIRTLERYDHLRRKLTGE